MLVGTKLNHTSKSCQNFNPKVRGVFVTEEMKKQTLGKKLALTLGIKAAQHDIIAFYGCRLFANIRP
jgi:hypothetical protein